VEAAQFGVNRLLSNYPDWRDLSMQDIRTLDAEYLSTFAMKTWRNPQRQADSPVAFVEHRTKSWNGTR